MDQQQFEEWVRQQGGQGRVQYDQAAKVIDNPAVTLAGSEQAGVEFDPTGPKKITVTEEKWTAVDAAGKPTGAVLHVQRKPDGSLAVLGQSGANPAARSGGDASTEPPKTEDRGGRHYVWQPNAPGTGGGGQWVDTGPAPATPAEQKAQEDPGTVVSTRQTTDANGLTTKITRYRRPDGTTYERPDTVQAEPAKPEVVASTLNTTSPYVGSVVNGVISWEPNPNYKKEKPEPLNLPPTQEWAVFRNEDNSTTTVKNPNYKPPSQIIKDPTTGRYQQITEDENHRPVIRDVTTETTVRPSDLPVLQAKYGEIGQGLGALAADLNRRYSSGEITAEERNRSFEAAHAQATTQVAEINTILDNSRAIWSGELQQRGQTLGETQSRRSYASSMLTNATGVGSAIAQSAGPGHGQAIAQGVQSLLNIGQNYAQGMGGFRESPEIQLPKALQQARETGLPGMAAPGSPAGLPGQSAGVGPSPTPVGPSPTPDASLTPAPASGFEAGSGISDTTDRGGVPREYTPASGSTPAPAGGASAGAGLQGLSAPDGINPLVAQLAQRLLGGQGYAGSPVAAGGGGVFDPMEEAARMTQGSDDPDWTAAVMRAARGNPDQQQPGYQRFFD